MTNAAGPRASAMSAGYAPDPAYSDVDMLAELAHHGDADLVPGLVDLAVNVRSSGTPRWLGGPLTYAGRIERRPELGSGPSPRAADIDRAVRLSRTVTWAATTLVAGIAGARLSV